MPNLKEVRANWYWWLLIIGLSIIPIFYNLTAHPIYIWDEAIYANNALEMALHKNFLVLENNGEWSQYNVKPPLVIWLQCICIWLFGGNELAIRLPSAVAALLTCFAVFYFASRNLNKTIGIFAVILLLTMPGYIRPHVVRTGDLDSVLVFFVTIYVLLFFEFLLHPAPDARTYFACIGAAVFGAFLTKSVAGFMPLLGLVVGMFATGQYRRVLFNKYVYFFVGTTILLCGAYYIIRENALPGYWEKVWFSEYSRFSKDIMPWHNQPWWFYINNIYVSHTFYFWVFAVVSIANVIFSRSKFGLFFYLSFIFCLVFLAVLSWPNVKLDWYDAPVYPVVSLLMAVGLYNAIACGLQVVKVNSQHSIIYGISICLISTFSYLAICQENAAYLPADALELDGYAIRELRKQQPELKHYKVLLAVDHIEHIDAVNFYIKSLNHLHDYNIEIINSVADVKPNDLVLCSQEKSREELAKVFKVDELLWLHDSQLLRAQ